MEREREKLRRESLIKYDITFYNVPAEFPLCPALSTYLSHSSHTEDMPPIGQHTHTHMHIHLQRQTHTEIYK